MFENPRIGRQASNFTTNIPKILYLKSSSEQIFSENWRWVPLKAASKCLWLPEVFTKHNKKSDLKLFFTPCKTARITLTRYCTFIELFFHPGRISWQATNRYIRSADCPKTKMASANLEEEDRDELNFGKLFVRTFSSSSPPDNKREAQWKIERLNLLNIANLCIKNVIDSGLKLGHAISDEHFEPFQQFFVVLESILRHGLKCK